LCVSFGLYPCNAPGVLNSVKEIHFYVLCGIKLNYVDYIEKWLDEFLLSSNGKTIASSFEAKQFPKQPSELIFVQSSLKNVCLSSLVFGIVCIEKRVTYITNVVLMSKHHLVFESYTCDLELPKKRAGCKFYTRYFSMWPFSMLYCTKKSHSFFRQAQCYCELCEKDGPAS